MVLKTSEKTPLSALHFAKLVVEAGFPEGTRKSGYRLRASYKQRRVGVVSLIPFAHLHLHLHLPKVLRARIVRADTRAKPKRS